MTTLVVMTVGRSDVQWLGRVGEHRVRLPLDSRAARLALLAPGAALDWCLDPAVRYWPELPGGRGAEEVAAHLAAGRPLMLFAPKLVPWLSYFGHGGSDAGAQVAECVILHTERETGTPFSAAEPVAAAPLLAQWLAGAPCHWPVQCVHALKGREDATKPADQRRFAARLLAALVGARRRGCERVLLLDSGGLPALKDVARLLCQSVFGPQQVERLTLSRPQPAGDVQELAAEGLITPLLPAEWPKACAEVSGVAPEEEHAGGTARGHTLESELRTRLAVADLIQRCQLAALPALLPSPWRKQGPHWAAQLLASVAWHTDTGHAGPMGSWPGGPPPGAGPQPGPGSGPPEAWVQAFRIECALATGATLEALTLTIEWFEALMVQAILAELRQWLAAPNLSLAEDGTIVGLDGLDERWVAHCLETRLPRLEPGGVWGVTRPNGAPVVMLARLPGAWRGAGPALALRRLSRHAIQAWCGMMKGPWGPVLSALHEALRKEVFAQGAGNEPACSYQLRNLKAHQGPSALGPNAAYRVRQVMAGAGLWHAAREGLAHGEHFLARPLPAAVLALLGLPQAAEQFRDWLGALERLVREAPLETPHEEQATEV